MQRARYSAASSFGDPALQNAPKKTRSASLVERRHRIDDVAGVTDHEGGRRRSDLANKCPIVLGDAPHGVGLHNQPRFERQQFADRGHEAFHLIGVREWNGTLAAAEVDSLHIVDDPCLRLIQADRIERGPRAADHDGVVEAGTALQPAGERLTVDDLDTGLSQRSRVQRSVVGRQREQGDADGRPRLGDLHQDAVHSRIAAAAIDVRHAIVDDEDARGGVRIAQFDVPAYPDWQ